MDGDSVPPEGTFFLRCHSLLIAGFKKWHENCFVARRQFCVYENYSSYILSYGIAC